MYMLCMHSEWAHQTTNRRTESGRLIAELIGVKYLVRFLQAPAYCIIDK